MGAVESDGESRMENLIALSERARSGSNSEGREKLSQEEKELQEETRREKCQDIKNKLYFLSLTEPGNNQETAEITIK